MREIKFRVWSERIKKMVDPKAITPLALNDGIIDLANGKDGLYLPFHDDCVLMQFTGLKDDDDTEIYEGDVVIDISGTRLIVEWNDDICQWQFSDGSPINSEERYSSYKLVVGNIYENPELLKT